MNRREFLRYGAGFAAILLLPLPEAAPVAEEAVTEEAVVSAVGTGGVFVPPVWLVEEYIPALRTPLERLSL